MEVLCSTGALIGRPNGRDPRLLGDFVKKLTGDGFEMMMYSTWYENVEEVTDYVRSLGLHIPVFHCQKTVGEEAAQGDFALAESQMEINAKMAEALGATKMVFHLWNGKISDFFIDNNLKAYGNLRKISADHGVDLLVENVVCFNENPMFYWRRIADMYEKPHFIFDTKMAAFHGQLQDYYNGDASWAWKETLSRQRLRRRHQGLDGAEDTSHRRGPHRFRGVLPICEGHRVRRNIYPRVNCIRPGRRGRL